MQLNPLLANLTNGANPAALQWMLDNGWLGYGSDEDGNQQLRSGPAGSGYGEGWEQAAYDAWGNYSTPKMDIGGQQWAPVPGQTLPLLANPGDVPAHPDLAGMSATDVGTSIRDQYNMDVPTRDVNGTIYAPQAGLDAVGAAGRANNGFIQSALDNGAGVYALAAPILSGGLLNVGPLAGGSTLGGSVFDLPGYLNGLMNPTTTGGTGVESLVGDPGVDTLEGPPGGGGEYNVTPETYDLPYTDSTMMPTETTVPPGTTNFDLPNLPPIPPAPPGGNYGDNIDNEQMQAPGGTQAPPVGNGPVNTTNGLAGTAASTALGRILSNGGSAEDWLSLGGSLLPSVLGAYSANRQADQQNALAQQYLNLGAPSRGRYEASFGPGFDYFAADPAAKLAAESTADITARTYSANGGDIYGNPGAKSGIFDATLNRSTLPALQSYRETNRVGGALGLPQAYQSQNAGIDANSALWGSIGAGIGAASTAGTIDPNSNWMRQMYGAPQLTLRA